MKKAISIILAMMLALGCVFAMTACGNQGDGGEENKTPVIPKGYKKFTLQDISFAYPEGWDEQSGSVTILADASGAGNNITVVYGDDDGTYDNMTMDKFNTTIKPAYEALGLAISDVSLETVKTNGLSVLSISYTASASGTSMSQTQYVVTIEGKLYAITITQATPDAKLVSTVLDTLCLTK